ncbi:flagellar motor switch protein FliN/FliY [Meinhardsimonia xiamenensis]|jgi:flagellar motor switch protein FliN/FliY|uniref:Flagellar motor switch protein FliN/FliY n=1 Tax=Meinhardsimonia xiamenensis TaxID=990712 RepID=A0A1G9EB50_9RHOB|nr:FliM/FliN family flagellar motor C-terminal domain-containing protein [Meinhardsimonia xiamenensis]PRX33852.1 flagellar motor switch protein FliN/FliY [Meinhardsimonia xiamenensis]SDK73301.1 flagellar motor switch protein FliN/FliY [Meinhardsimonia xiamenensis]
MPENKPQPAAPPGDGSGRPFWEVPIEVRVCVGHARPRIGELLALGPEAVLPLDRRVEDPVELYVGDQLIARGELQELDGDRAGLLAVKLTELARSSARE